VPHTVEEAYEVADAALAGNSAKLLDELGDLLFQVYFLALLLAEQGHGDLEDVARGVHDPDAAGALADLKDELAELEHELESGGAARRAEELGDLLFACVNVARRLNVDPELELRRATGRFVARVEEAERLAAAEGREWTALPLLDQDRYFDLAKERE
jgi:NTP pyrophosphatase (non-canonical NTP hydrolase)